MKKMKRKASNQWIPATNSMSKVNRIEDISISNASKIPHMNQYKKTICSFKTRSFQKASFGKASGYIWQHLPKHFFKINWKLFSGTKFNVYAAQIINAYWKGSPCILHIFNSQKNSTKKQMKAPFLRTFSKTNLQKIFFFKKFLKIRTYF